MELSGLIFVALALVWAVVLLPKALKHHDDQAESRSSDGASDGMRVLARREAVSSRSSRLVVTSEEPAPARGEPTAPTDRPLSGRAHRVAATAAARRRRRVLLLLLVTTAASGSATFAGPVPSWAPAVPAASIVVFLLVARITVRRERARREALFAAERDHRRSNAASEVSLPATQATTATVSLQDAAEADVAGSVAKRAQELGLDDTQAIWAKVLAEGEPTMEPTTDPGTLWDPLPVTLPTYVGKPRATRSVRTIDLSAEDVASAGRDAAASALVAEAATAAGPEGPEQRAVGS